MVFDGDGYNQTEKSSKSLIQGTQLDDGKGPFMIKDVSFTNVNINGSCVTDANKAAYVDIERDDFGKNTTQDIVFNGCVNSHTITINAGVGGSVSPTVDSMKIATGGSQTFKIFPLAGKSIKSVTVDGASQGTGSSVTLSNVTADTVLVVEFE